MKTVLITGIAGQDGQYAAELCVARGDRVVGTGRDLAAMKQRLAPTLQTVIELHSWDTTSLDETESLIADIGPDEVFNFAAASSGTGMYDDPVAIGEINGISVARLLEAIRRVQPSARFCQASSSELFGMAVSSPQSETTVMHPRSPYGAAKLYAHTMVEVYRRHYGIFACSAILFNHESPRRDPGFVTRKVSRAAAAISLGIEHELYLGNLAAVRDWGFAGDTVAAMALMLGAQNPGDYVVATGVGHSVADLCRIAFAHVSLDYRDFVRENAANFRSVEPVALLGDATRVRELGWSPTVDFPKLVAMMVDADLFALSEDRSSRN